MKIQAFIANWASPTTDAEQVQSILSTYCPAHILDAYDVPFMYQWKEMLEKFDGDIMLWVMADVRPTNFAGMFPEMVRILSRPDVGVYAPFVDHTSQQSNKALCVQIEPEVYQVAANDLVIVALTSKMLSLMPPVNPTENPRAWCYDYLMASRAYRNGLRVVRDYRFVAFHPKGSIYDTMETLKKTKEWIQTLPPEDAKGISDMQDRAYAELIGGVRPR